VQNNKLKSKLGPLWPLLRFFLSYAVLFFIYSLYEKYSVTVGSVFDTDPITKVVARQASTVIRFFGYESHVIQSKYSLSMDLYIDESFVARVIEGCNAVSIMILFVAFMIAFAQKFKITALYTIFGLFVLHVVNITRIATLAIGIYEMPENSAFLHDIVFPAVIYGVTMTLWLVWIKRYAPKPKRNE
jgi:exosortase family protein XrtF